MSESTKGYVEQNHPVQQRILKITEHLTNHSLGQKTLAIDGCSIPAPSFPLKKVAQAFCEFGQPKTLPDRESMACKRVFDAFTRFPTLTSGTDHYCEKAMKQSKLPILVKMGAEGIIGGCLPERSLGFFLKSVDGSHRASELVLTHLMHQWNLLSSESSLLNTKMSNWENRETGYLRLKDNPDFKVLS